MAGLNPEIRVVEELRPAIVNFRSLKGTDMENLKVLVHTIRMGAHGGFIAEDSHGHIHEIVIDQGTTLTFRDDKFQEYLFPEEI